MLDLECAADKGELLRRVVPAKAVFETMVYGLIRLKFIRAAP